MMTLKYLLLQYFINEIQYSYSFFVCTCSLLAPCPVTNQIVLSVVETLCNIFCARKYRVEYSIVLLFYIHIYVN